MVCLDWVALEDAQALLGHHANGWRPNQSTMEPTPQQPVETTKAYQRVERDHIGEFVTSGRMAPLLEWNQKNVGHLT